LCGGQLVLSLGAKSASHQIAGEAHPMPIERRVPAVLGVFGVVALVSGIAMVVFGGTEKNEDRSM
jgi:hypothetical protein